MGKYCYRNGIDKKKTKLAPKSLELARKHLGIKDAYSGEDDRSFRLNVTVAQREVLRA